MTVMAEQDLISEYTVNDPSIRARLDDFDTDKTNWSEYKFLGEGGEREAWLDTTNNLVYKRLHTDNRSWWNTHSDLFDEIPSLDKAHAYLSEHPEHNIRYAETYYYINAHGKQFMVQEYVENLGTYQLRTEAEAFHTIIFDATPDIGISDDDYWMNYGRDTNGMLVLTDMLKVG